MRYQRTDLLPSKSKQKQHSHKPRSKGQNRYSSEQRKEGPPYKQRFDPSEAHQRRDRCSKFGDSKHMESFRCPTRKFQCKTCNKYGHFTSLCYKAKFPLSQELPRHISCKWELFIHKKIQYAASQVI